MSTPPDHNDAFAAELEAEDTAKADRRLAGYIRQREVWGAPTPPAPTDRELLERLLTAVAHHLLATGHSNGTNVDLHLWDEATAISEELER
jgi:2-C-methyl-D-erythritol 4-phosphate cytidylyltransferase